MKRIRLASGFDAASAGLILGGALLVAISIVASAVLLAPPRAAQPPTEELSPTPLVSGRTSAVLPPDRVATVLTVDATAGAAAGARSGDHIDVLGYFARQGGDAVTRVLLADVPVLGVDRAGERLALTLALPQESALRLQEAQALGAQPFVLLRAVQDAADVPASFSDVDLATRLSSGAR